VVKQVMVVTGPRTRRMPAPLRPRTPRRDPQRSCRGRGRDWSTSAVAAGPTIGGSRQGRRRPQDLQGQARGQHGEGLPARPEASTAWRSRSLPFAWDGRSPWR